MDSQHYKMYCVLFLFALEPNIFKSILILLLDCNIIDIQQQHIVVILYRLHLLTLGNGIRLKMF